jgi:hypothetical protein
VSITWEQRAAITLQPNFKAVGRFAHLALSGRSRGRIHSPAGREILKMN